MKQEGHTEGTRTMTTHTTINHPASGETYAVKIAADGRILSAHGPLDHTDPTDPESIETILANQFSDELKDTARWLSAELA